MKCPKCGKDCEADFIDIGVGEQRIGPWYCVPCEWIEEWKEEDFDIGEDGLPW